MSEPQSIIPNNVMNLFSNNPAALYTTPSNNLQSSINNGMSIAPGLTTDTTIKSEEKKVSVHPRFNSVTFTNPSSDTRQSSAFTNVAASIFDKATNPYTTQETKGTSSMGQINTGSSGGMSIAAQKPFINSEVYGMNILNPSIKLDTSTFDVTKMTSQKSSSNNSRTTNNLGFTGVNLIPMIASMTPDTSSMYTSIPTSRFDTKDNTPHFWIDKQQQSRDIEDLRNNVNLEQASRQQDKAVTEYKMQQESTKTANAAKRLEKINTDIEKLNMRSSILDSEYDNVNTYDPEAVKNYNSNVIQLQIDAKNLEPEIQEGKDLSNSLSTSNTILTDLQDKTRQQTKSIYDLALGEQNIEENIRSRDIIYSKIRDLNTDISGIRELPGKTVPKNVLTQTFPLISEISANPKKVLAESLYGISNFGLGVTSTGRDVGEFVAVSPLRTASKGVYVEDTIPGVLNLRGIYNWRDPTNKNYKESGSIINTGALSGALTTGLSAFGIGEAVSAGVVLPSTAARSALSTGAKTALTLGGIGLAGGLIIGPSAYEMYQTSKSTSAIDTQLQQLEKSRKANSIDIDQYNLQKNYLQKQKDIYEKTGVTSNSIGGRIAFSTGELAANIALPIGAASMTKMFVNPTGVIGDVGLKYKGTRSISTEGGQLSQYINKEGNIVLEPSIPRNAKYTATFKERPAGIFKSGEIDTKIVVTPVSETNPELKLARTRTYKDLKYVTTQTQGDTEAVTKIYDKKGSLLKTLKDKPVQITPGTVDTQIRRIWDMTPVTTEEQLSPSQIQQFIQNARKVNMQADVGKVRISGVGIQSESAKELATASPTRQTLFEQSFIKPEGKNAIDLGPRIKTTLADKETRLAIGDPEYNIFRNLQTENKISPPPVNGRLPTYTVTSTETETPYLSILRNEKETGSFNLQYKPISVLDRLQESNFYSGVKSAPEKVSRAVDILTPTRMLSNKRGEVVLKGFSDNGINDFTGIGESEIKGFSSINRPSSEIGTNKFFGQSSGETSTVTIPESELKTSRISRSKSDITIPKSVFESIYTPSEVSGISEIAGLSALLGVSKLKTFGIGSTNFLTSSIPVSKGISAINALSITNTQVTPVTQTQVQTVTSNNNVAQSSEVTGINVPKIRTMSTLPSSFGSISALPFAGMGFGPLPGAEPVARVSQGRSVRGVRNNYLRNLFFDPSTMKAAGIMITGTPRTFKIGETNFGKGIENAIGKDTTSTNRRLVHNSAPFKKLVKRMI